MKNGNFNLDMYFATDDQSIGGPSESALPVRNESANPDTPSVGSPERPEPKSAEEPAHGEGLSADEVEERSFRAAQRAIAEMRRRDEEDRMANEVRQAEQRRFSHRPPNPTGDALDALDLRNDLYEEALNLHPDMPQDARQQLKEDLRSFKTVEALRAARDSGLHKKLSDAAAGRAIRDGRYVPRSVSSTSVTREPAASEPIASRVPEAYRRQQQEVASFLGVQLTEQELLEAYELDAARA